MPFDNMRKKIKQQLSDVLEIPDDIMLDLPKITIVGDGQVSIENHKGIISYSTECIKISVSTGEVEVKGKELVLRNILPEAINIEGKIKSVALS